MPVGGNMRLGFGPKVDKRTGEKENYVTGYKQYSKECTIRINYISTESIRAISVVKAVEEITGLNSVLAVVRDSNSYNVTLDSKENTMKLLNGVEIDGKDYDCSLVFSNNTVVSFMYIPAFIEDDEIINKLNEKGIRVVSPVYRRVIPGTQVADGTRFMRCVFPPNVVALPWTMPFKVGKDTKYYKCVHNNQTKVCSGCLSPEHIHKECPYLVCNGCGVQGHVEKRCKANTCGYCHELPLKCKCSRSDHTTERQRRENITKCPDCNTINCVCKCKHCRKNECVCTCTYCHSEPCVCPCSNCDKDPCECVCEKCGSMNCSCWDKLSLDDNEVNDDEDTEIEIMRPKRGLDQNEKTNQTPVNEKSGNSESKSKSEEEVEGKENVNIEAVLNADSVQNETRKRKIAFSENICSDEDENEDTEMNGQHKECEIIPSCNEISSHIGDENTGSKKIKKNIDTPCKNVTCDELEFEDFDIEEWERKNNVLDDRKTPDDQKSEVLIESLQSVGEENMDEEEEVKTMSSGDDTFNMSAKELRKLKKKERKVARRAMLKVTPNVNISRSSQVTDNNK